MYVTKNRGIKILEKGGLDDINRIYIALLESLSFA